MDLSANRPRNRDSPDKNEETVDADIKPKDLSIKPNMKRLKPIPPPLNLSTENNVEDAGSISTTLKEFAILATGPRSPLMQKNLPFRKRAHSVPDAEEAPLSAPPAMLKSFQTPWRNDGDQSRPGAHLSLPATPKFLSAPLPLIPIDHNLGSMSHPASPRHFLTSGVAETPFPHPSFSRYYSQAWNPFFSSVPIAPAHWLNGSPSALLSPAPSSLGSSQEDLRIVQSMGIIPHMTYEAEPWQLPWPHPVWHCFQPGVLLKLSIGGSEVTVRAEEISHRSEFQSLVPERMSPLRVQFIDALDISTGMVQVTFICSVVTSSGVSSDFQFSASCHLHHTFLVLDKGWCAISPEATLQYYGAQCPPLECGDCCLPQPKLSSPGICEKFKRFSFSPEEVNSSNFPPSSPFVLSPPITPTNAHSFQQQASSQSRPPPPPPLPSSQNRTLQPPQPPKQKTGKQKSSQKAPKLPLDPDRPKRPMNAFMLFAKQHRLKLIQMHPGKDNRFVSVILGEAWKSLPADQKEVFIAEAKALSHERKMLFPECWKRKRSHSTS